MAEATSAEMGRPEVNDSPEARAQDIREFWKGFEEFRNANADLEKNIDDQLNHITKSSGRIASKVSKFAGLRKKVDLDVAKEAAMVFMYGVKLARDLRPSFTDEFDIPDLEIMPDNEPDTFQISGVLTWFDSVLQNVDWSKFVTSLGRLQNPNDYTSKDSINEQWRMEGRKTASLFLKDIVILDLVRTGAEEYSHDLYYRAKVGRLTIEKDEEEDRIAEENSGDSYDEWIGYHSSDVERRALIWQQRVTEKYFPHWAGHSREFMEHVRQLRRSKMTKRNPSVQE